MKFILLTLAVLATGMKAQAEELKSQGLKKLVAAEIQEYAATWSTEELGSVWIVNYFSQGQGAEFIEGRPDTYGFELVSRESKSHLKVNVTFICGTEYDESELWGDCDIDVKRNARGKWQPVIDTCRCGY